MSSASKKKIDRLWTELYRLKTSHKQFENLAVLQRINEILDDFSKEDYESKYIVSVKKILSDITDTLDKKVPSVQKEFKIFLERINIQPEIKKTSPPKLRKSPSLASIADISKKQDIEILENIENILKQREKEKDVKYAIEEGRRSTQKAKQEKELRISSLKKYISKSKDKRIKIKSKISRSPSKK